MQTRLVPKLHGKLSDKLICFATRNQWTAVVLLLLGIAAKCKQILRIRRNDFPKNQTLGFKDGKFNRPTPTAQTKTCVQF